ncbi:MAG: response regulator [Bryobacteraceae bacterium]|jgi:CheY-like chemotaxis protein
MDQQPRETVLLVDDEPHVVALVKKMLLRAGYSVLSATDPEEAIRLVEAQEAGIDLLLTDVAMPQLNGRELADRLKAMRRGLRVLYMSGFMKEALLKYYSISIAGIPFVQKPFTPETLASRVREVLDAPAAEAAGSGGEMR